MSPRAFVLCLSTTCSSLSHFNILSHKPGAEISPVVSIELALLSQPLLGLTRWEFGCELNSVQPHRDQQ